MVSYDSSHTLHICAAQHVLPHCTGVCRQSERHMYSTAWHHMNLLTPYTPVRRSAYHHTAQVCVESQKGICILLRETVWILAVYQFWKGILAGPALKYFTWFIGAGRCILLRETVWISLSHPTNLCCAARTVALHRCVQGVRKTNVFYCMKPCVSSDILHTRAAQHVLPHRVKPYVSSDTLHTHAAQHVLPHCAGARRVSERRMYFIA